MRQSISLALFGFFSFAIALPLVGQNTAGVPKHSSQDQKKAVKVFGITHADATELKSIVEELFGNANDPNSRPSVQLRFTVDLRTNSLIASGPDGDLQVIEDLLIRLDSEEPAPKKTTVYRMRNAPAADVADAINEWLEEREKTDTTDGMNADRAALTAMRNPVVVAEPVSNSLIVSTPREGNLSQQLEGMIRGLDASPDMIKIKVLLKKTVNGQETVICQPHLITLDRNSGSITVGSENESYTIELTPHVIRGDKPTEGTTIPK